MVFFQIWGSDNVESQALPTLCFTVFRGRAPPDMAGGHKTHIQTAGADEHIDRASVELRGGVMLKAASSSRGPSLSKAWEVAKAHKGAYR